MLMFKAGVDRGRDPYSGGETMPVEFAEDRIAELEEEVSYLKGLLGERIEDDRVSTLKAALNVPPAAVRVALALYRAKGRTIRLWSLEECCRRDAASDADYSSNIVSIYICRLRNALGQDNIRTEWGRGYALTEAGLAHIAAILAAADRRGFAVSGMKTNCGR